MTYEELQQAIEANEVRSAFYWPSQSYEWFDGYVFFNATGQQLRHPDSFADEDEY